MYVLAVDSGDFGWDFTNMLMLSGQNKVSLHQFGSVGLLEKHSDTLTM